MLIFNIYYMENEMINLIKRGFSYKEVSEILGITPNSIRSRCFRLGIKSSDYKKDKTTFCLECETKTNNNKFCSKNCSATYNNKFRSKIKTKKYCINCKTELNNRQKKYCSKDCQTEYEYEQYIQKWKNGEEDGNTGKNKDALSSNVRRYIIKKYDYKCAKCGWNKVNEYTGKIPLEIDHIDGNHLNSIEENLIALCPSCHSLTEFYGGRNKGRGRKYRRK